MEKANKLELEDAIEKEETFIISSFKLLGSINYRKVDPQVLNDFLRGLARHQIKHAENIQKLTTIKNE